MIVIRKKHDKSHNLSVYKLLLFYYFSVLNTNKV